MARGAHGEVFAMFIQMPPPSMLKPPPPTAENNIRQKMPSFFGSVGKPEAAMEMADKMAAIETTVPVLAISLNHSIPPMK